MTRFRVASITLLALGFVACADSSREQVAPERRADAGFFANGSDDEQEDFSERGNIAIRTTAIRETQPGLRLAVACSGAAM